MLSTEENKLDPRVRRTRQVLVDSFNALLEKKGFDAVSVNDITAQAGVNRATFYAHFSDKYALLNHAIRESFRQSIERRTLNACRFSTDNLHLLIATVCEFVGDIHAHNGAAEQFQSLAEAQIREQVYQLVLAWLENMETIQRCTVSRERAATATSWALYGLAHQWAHEKQRPDPSRFAGEVLPLVAANLGQTIELA